MALEWNGPQLVATLRARAGEAAKVVAERVLADAQTAVPVDTGALKNSGHLVEDPSGTAVYIVYDAPHAVLVHDGTPRMAARPWLARAVIQETNAALATFRAIAGA